MKPKDLYTQLTASAGPQERTVTSGTLVGKLGPMEDTLTVDEVQSVDDETYTEDELLVEEISIDGMCGVY